MARENAPSIIFIDEVDAIATKRFDAQTGADREVQRILLELLNQMDGFDQGSNVKVGRHAFFAHLHWNSNLFLSLCRSSWPLTDRIHWIPLFYVQDVWTGRSSSPGLQGESED
jgi:hypothetical protein